MKTIAIIPARGGSKRIPKKNIIDFMGKPMMVWTIEAAINSGVFDRIILSTDDPEIAEIGRNYGLEVPFLRTDKIDDISPVSEATICAVKQAEEFYNEKYDVVIQLMANAPMRNANDILEHFNNFQVKNNSFQISSFKFGWMNPWWAAKVEPTGTPKWIHPETIGSRSQDLDDLFCPTGVIWIAKTEELKKAKSFYGDGYRFHEINWKNAVDIDDYEDLEFAKALYILEKNKINHKT